MRDRKVEDPLGMDAEQLRYIGSGEEPTRFEAAQLRPSVRCLAFIRHRRSLRGEVATRNL